ncbi:MAG TPA: hypothetical protein DIW77_17855 [Chromatiaceae bacterium]|nr:MAG: hypothetical protein N838_03000 [Thiohalocapsa sp. PB-PSB1]HCS91853.1 hypothetical protein [Chromatiaceae bacterium]
MTSRPDDKTSQVVYFSIEIALTLPYSFRFAQQYTELQRKFTKNLDAVQPKFLFQKEGNG